MEPIIGKHNNSKTINIKSVDLTVKSLFKMSNIDTIIKPKGIVNRIKPMNIIRSSDVPIKNNSIACL